MLTTNECLLKEDKDCMRNMCKLCSPDPHSLPIEGFITQLPYTPEDVHRRQQRR